MYISKIRECSTYRETLLKQGENRRNIKLNLWVANMKKPFPLFYGTSECFMNVLYELSWNICKINTF